MTELASDEPGYEEGLQRAIVRLEGMRDPSVDELTGRMGMLLLYKGSGSQRQRERVIAALQRHLRDLDARESSDMSDVLEVALGLALVLRSWGMVSDALGLMRLLDEYVVMVEKQNEIWAELRPPPDSSQDEGDDSEYGCSDDCTCFDGRDVWLAVPDYTVFLRAWALQRRALERVEAEAGRECAA